MSIKRNLLIPLLTAVLGFLAGGVLASRYWIRQGAVVTELHNQLSAQQHVRSLRQLRSGKTEELIAETEILLDGDVIGLGYDAKNSPSNKEAARTVLGRVAAYRKDYPHSSPNPEVAKAVDHAFTFASR